MDKNKLIIIILIVGLGVVITLLLISYLSAPTYSEILNRVEQLMMGTENVSLSYVVDYSASLDGVFEELNGTAHYELIGDSMTWNNTLASLEGTFYDLRPSDLLPLLKKSIISEVVDYGSALPCYLLNGVVNQTLSGDLIVGDYNYVRVMACMSKTTGYPLMYTLLVIGGDSGVLVDYNSLAIVASEPKPFNESAFV
jgi:hypothetical protein